MRDIVRLLVGFVLLAPTLGAYAEAARQGSDQAARFQAMLQQLNDDKTKLASENAKLKADLAKAQSELESASKSRDEGATKLTRTGQDLVNSQAKNDALQRAFDTLRSRFDQLVEQYRTTVGAMKGVERERDQSKTLVDHYETRVATCERNNEVLYKSDLELIDLYEHKGVFTSLMQKEPITQLKRVQIENLMDQYRALGEEMRIEPTPRADDSARAQVEND